MSLSRWRDQARQAIAETRAAHPDARGPELRKLVRATRDGRDMMTISWGRKILAEELNVIDPLVVVPLCSVCAGVGWVSLGEGLGARTCTECFGNGHGPAVRVCRRHTDCVDRPDPVGLACALGSAK